MPTLKRKRSPRPKPKQIRLGHRLVKNAGAETKARMINGGNRDTKVIDVGTETDAMGEALPGLCRHHCVPDNMGT